MAAVELEWETRPALLAALSLTVESPEAVEKYALIAERLGMTEGAVGKAAHDLRQHSLNRSIKASETPWRGIKMSKESFATW